MSKESFYIYVDQYFRNYYIRPWPRIAFLNLHYGNLNVLTLEVRIICIFVIQLLYLADGYFKNVIFLFYACFKMT